MEHSRLGCSNTRWPYCSGSVREEANYPDKTSDAAVSGTGSHELLSMVLSNVRPTGMPAGEQLTAHSYVGLVIGKGHKDKPEGWLIDQERADRVQMAIDYVHQRITQYRLNDPINIMTEKKTNPGQRYGRDDWQGTCDITLYNDTFLEVIDYKDGYTYVSEDTSQLVAYALGQNDFINEFRKTKIQVIRKTIIQPKGRDPIRYIEESAEDNDKLGEKLAFAAGKTDDLNAPLIAGEHCQWCKHKLNCSSRNQIAVATINGPISPIQMTPDELSKANEAIPMILSFIESIEKETENKINSGIEVPNYAMVAGRPPHPVWTDEELAMKKLTGMRIEQKLRNKSKIITPTAALKLEKLSEPQKKTLEKLIHREKATKKLKRVTRKKLTAKEMFPEGKTPEEIFPNVDHEKSVISPFLEKKVSVINIYVMTEKANGLTAEEFKSHDPAWTDELLVLHGFMQPLKKGKI